MSIPPVQSASKPSARRYLTPVNQASACEKICSVGETTVNNLRKLEKPVTNIAAGISLIGFALAAGLGGATGATFAGAGSSLDILFKILMLVVAPVAGIFGVKKMINYTGEVKRIVPPPNGSYVTVKDQRVLADSKDALVAINDIDPAYQSIYDSENRSKITFNGFSGLNKDNLETLRGAVNKLSFAYRRTLGPNGELRYSQERTPGDSAPLIVRDIVKNPMSIPKVSEELATQLGFLICSRVDNKDDIFKDITTTILKDYGVIKPGVEVALPPVFNLIYNAAGYYAKKHQGKNNSLDGLKLPPDGKLTKQYEENFQETYNSIKILSKAIEYITSNFNTKDEDKARRVALYSYAVASAFRLKGDYKCIIDQIRAIGEGSETVDGLKVKQDELNKVFNGEEGKVIGVKSKLEEKYNITSLKLSGDQIFNKEFGCFSFEPKPHIAN